MREAINFASVALGKFDALSRRTAGLWRRHAPHPVAQRRFLLSGENAPVAPWP
jgi:hypothetical protein